MNVNSIKAIQNSNRLFYITATGGGTSFLGEFLKIPGGSKCIVGGQVTYAIEATDYFVGSKLDKYSDGMAACKLAVASYEHCLKLKSDKTKCVGVGVACSLAKDNERVGRIHTVNIAIHNNEYTFVVEINLPTGMDRLKEENLTNECILNILNELYVINMPLAELTEMLNSNFASEIGLKFKASHCYSVFPNSDVFISHEGKLKNTGRIAIYPGSFNPLHPAHIEIKERAEKILGMPVYFELTPFNSYKPAIDHIEVFNRLLQFDESILITTAPRFVDKVTKLKQTFGINEIIIVVGADTWRRVYDDAAYRNGDIKFFEDNNVKFLVFGRNSELIENQDSPLFIKHDDAVNFNNPLSSTELRNAMRASA